MYPEVKPKVFAFNASSVGEINFKVEFYSFVHHDFTNEKLLIYVLHGEIETSQKVVFQLLRVINFLSLKYFPTTGNRWNSFHSTFKTNHAYNARSKVAEIRSIIFPEKKWMIA
jgi:hypothetical protein